MRRDDYIVKERSWDSISDITSDLRRRLDVDHLARVDVIKILDYLMGVELPYKGRLQLVELEDDEVDPYVDFNPLTLHISGEMIQHSRWGDPDSTYKIAHEIGHLILHDHYAQSFSKDSTLYVKSVPKERSAESQANAFAYFLLVPDRFVRLFKSVQQIMELCGVSEQVARDRVADVFSQKRKCVGEACPECGNFTLVRIGLSLKCDICGNTTECS